MLRFFRLPRAWQLECLQHKTPPEQAAALARRPISVFTVVR